MRRYLLDTGSAGDYLFRRHDTPARVRQAQARGDRVGICLPVLGELWAGIELSESKAKNRPLLIRGLKTLALWPFDIPAAEEYGRLLAVLRRKGRPIPQVDIQTAAIALSLGNCTVVTKDKHFNSVPGLKIEDWARD